MKKINAFLFCLFFSNSIFSQSPAQLDSTNVHITDSLYNIKEKYIGKPFGYLLDDINLPVDFSRPEGLGNRRKGIGYYLNPMIFLSSKPGIPLRGFEVIFSEKLPVDVGQERYIGYEEWDKKIRCYLRKAIVIEIKKLK